MALIDGSLTGRSNMCGWIGAEHGNIPASKLLSRMTRDLVGRDVLDTWNRVLDFRRGGSS